MLKNERPPKPHRPTNKDRQWKRNALLGSALIHGAMAVGLGLTEPRSTQYVEQDRTEDVNKRPKESYTDNTEAVLAELHETREHNTEVIRELRLEAWKEIDSLIDEYIDANSSEYIGGATPMNVYYRLDAFRKMLEYADQATEKLNKQDLQKRALEYEKQLNTMHAERIARIVDNPTYTWTGDIVHDLQQLQQATLIGSQRYFSDQIHPDAAFYLRDNDSADNQLMMGMPNCQEARNIAPNMHEIHNRLDMDSALDTISTVVWEDHIAIAVQLPDRHTGMTKTYVFNELSLSHPITPGLQPPEAEEPGVVFPLSMHLSYYLTLNFSDLPPDQKNRLIAAGVIPQEQLPRYNSQPIPPYPIPLQEYEQRVEGTYQPEVKEQKKAIRLLERMQTVLIEAIREDSDFLVPSFSANKGEFERQSATPMQAPSWMNSEAFVHFLETPYFAMSLSNYEEAIIKTEGVRWLQFVNEETYDRIIQLYAQQIIDKNVSLNYPLQYSFWPDVQLDIIRHMFVLKPELKTQWLELFSFLFQKQVVTIRDILLDDCFRYQQISESLAAQADIDQDFRTQLQQVASAVGTYIEDHPQFRTIHTYSREEIPQLSNEQIDQLLHVTRRVVDMTANSYRFSIVQSAQLPALIERMQHKPEKVYALIEGLYLDSADNTWLFPIIEQHITQHPQMAQRYRELIENVAERSMPPASVPRIYFDYQQTQKTIEQYPYIGAWKKETLQQRSPNELRTFELNYFRLQQYLPDGTHPQLPEQFTIDDLVASLQPAHTRTLRAQSNDYHKYVNERIDNRIVQLYQQLFNQEERLSFLGKLDLITEAKRPFVPWGKLKPEDQRFIQALPNDILARAENSENYFHGRADLVRLKLLYDASHLSLESLTAINSDQLRDILQYNPTAAFQILQKIDESLHTNTEKSIQP
ncbi:MAG TPA: hypothetical protein VJB65_02630 [Patescibacteria group bacterium]|nr:hypothetical protein [Patescibacteria group bacterium]